VDILAGPGGQFAQSSAWPSDAPTTGPQQSIGNKTVTIAANSKINVENFALEGKVEFYFLNPSVTLLGDALRCGIG